MESDIRISIEHAAEIAKTQYQIEGKITPLPGESDFNFRIQTEVENYILKISRPEESIEFIEFQRELLEHVSRSTEKITCPILIPNIEGNPTASIKDECGRVRIVRVLSWIDGRMWSSVNPISDSLLYNLGTKAGEITRSLKGFEHAHSQRIFDWDIAQVAWTKKYIHLFSEEERQIATYFQSKFDDFQKDYKNLRKSVVHNDVNDNNIVVNRDFFSPQVHAIIDFGDAIHTMVINDVAIVIAYAAMHKSDPLSASLAIVRGYHTKFALQEKELKYLYTLVAMRLLITVSKSAINKQKEPENAYLQISEKPAWELLKKWRHISEDFAHYSFRQACGFTPHPARADFDTFAKKNKIALTSLFPTVGYEKIHCLDLSVYSRWIGHQSDFNDLDFFQYKIDKLQSGLNDEIIAGGYLEPRPIYTSNSYDKIGNHGRESRSIHIGIDFWLPAQTPVHALFDGEVFTAVNDAGDKEYGGLIILKHEEGGCVFYTLHGHLSLSSIQDKNRGDRISKGDRIGYIGDYPENGNWAPHLHFQIMLSMLDYKDDFPGVCYPDQLNIWKGICPDPNQLFKQKNLEYKPETTNTNLIEYRKRHLGKSLSLSYDDPLRIVRGLGVYLFDNMGRKYLDIVNNVAHVGHEHPNVVRAGQQQMAVLNTNTRYLHEEITLFAEALLATLPDELSVVHFVNSGSEANELALRMAKAYTHQKDIIALEVGYHGNTSACIDVSSYKFDSKGGIGTPETTHIVPLPDSFRGRHQGNDTTENYAKYVQQQIDTIRSKGRKTAAFIGESIVSCGGQIELPEGYLQKAYTYVRADGGLCIADEVQTGCGRVGKAFWGFQLHDVVPDIVTIGKPIGNGHPVAAVVCTREVADAFANGMEYFNTFGGNPVSCAIGRAVLNVIKEEKLQENALHVGNYLKEGFYKLQQKHPIIGDIRGQGLFLGIELVDTNKQPQTEKAKYLINRAKDFRILMSTDGKDNNVLKIKPPMVFSKENADELLNVFDAILKEDFMVLK